MDRPASILIIDDDPGTCETVGDVLRLRGHTVETAARGGEGLDKLRARGCDAVIVDIKLPDVSGLEILQRIKSTSWDTEVIFITGYASLPTAIQAINGAAFAYLVKPFEMDHLLATLAKALEKQRLARALRESEERYRLINESIEDAVFLLDTEGHVLLWNRRSEELTGYREGELRGRAIFSLLTGEEPEKAEARLEAARAGREVSPFVEVQLLRKDGSRVWVEASVTSVLKEGRAVGRLAVARDISERKRADEAQARLQAHLAQSEKLAAMGQLLAGVAHELNNPLSVVVGQAALLREAVGPGPAAARVEKIVNAGERCARIVRNFLAMARERPLERQRIHLNQVVQEALELLAYRLRVDNVDVKLDLAPDLPVLWADPHQLHQVVVNLVTNAQHALRATPPPRSVTLTSRFDPVRERVSLELADTGPGIPSEIQGRIFEPFFTTKPPGQGTGLGLFLCQAMIQGHRGTITLESAPGKGAVFRVDLPVEAAPSPAREVGVPDEGRGVGGKAILVVDDEPEVAALLADLLARDGHRVDTAANGVVALERLEERAYDLVVTDMRMPELDGPGLYRELARRHPGVRPGFIFLTGDTFAEETSEFLEETGAASLSKPFALEEVRQAVQRALRGR